MKYKEFKVDWKKFGKKAGMIRNEEMHKYIKNFEHKMVFAFWNGESKGTQSNFDFSKKNIKILLLFTII